MFIEVYGKKAGGIVDEEGFGEMTIAEISFTWTKALHHFLTPDSKGRGQDVGNGLKRGKGKLGIVHQDPCE